MTKVVAYVTLLSLLFYNLAQPFCSMFMHLSSIGSDLLVSLEDRFYQRLLRHAKQKLFLYKMRAT